MFNWLSNSSMGKLLMWLGMAASLFFLLGWMGPSMSTVIDSLCASEPTQSGGPLKCPSLNWDKLKEADCAPPYEYMACCLLPALMLIGLGMALWRQDGRPSGLAARVWTVFSGVVVVCILVCLGLSSCPYSPWRLQTSLILVFLAFLLFVMLSILEVILGVRKALRLFGL